MGFIDKQHSTQEEEEKRKFIFSNALKGVIWLGAILGGYLLAVQLLPQEWNEIISPFTDRAPLMFGVFFLSETFIGIIPPELFIIWAANKSFSTFILYMILLALISWSGGVIAYWVGKQFHRTRWIQRLTQRENFQRYAQLYRKFGAVVIVVSALTPLPYAMISFLSATFRFPFNKYLIYSSTRFLRFVFLGWLFWNLGVS